MSYSQRNEESVILETLKALGPGKFLDIGAWSLDSLSNTRALWERGWHGVMVEPSPGPMREMLKRREPRYEFIQAAVAVSLSQHAPPGSVRLPLEQLVISDDALSTTSPRPEWLENNAGGFFGSLWVPVVSLRTLIGMFGPFEFVSIDTEGTSFALFSELLTVHAPTCICVEHDGRFAEFSEVVSEDGRYREIARTEENLIYGR